MPKLKLVILLIVIVAMAVAGYLLINNSSAEPKINLPIDYYDLGRVRYGDVASHQFRILNIGKQPLEILKISTSCGCTTTQMKKRVIAPGEQDKLTVFFNPAVHKDGTDLGEVDRIVYLKTNDPEYPEVELRIHAFVYKE